MFSPPTRRTRRGTGRVDACAVDVPRDRIVNPMTLEHFPPPARIAALLGILLLSACGTEQIDPPFYRAYRDQYAITAEELKTLQFYISGDVLAHAVDASGGGTPAQAVIVKQRTPGLVREVGPNWLRVAFTEGGEGVLFRLRSRSEERRVGKGCRTGRWPEQ